MNGILIVDKKKGITSFDVVRDVRKKYNTKKVGHIGTLDPLATGVLPILVGKATGLSNYLMEHEKEYVTILSLGKSTDTGDIDGNVITEQEINKSIYNNIHRVCESFLGESMQIPPMYSAIKVNGKKLYELAREGKTVERKPRKITIFDIEILNINKEENEIEFKVTCSKGTYIRTLCEDIAKKLGTIGYMKELRRTRVGSFKIEDTNKFIEMEDILQDIPKIQIHDYDKLINGMKLPFQGDYEGLVNIYFDGKYIGIGEAKNNTLKRKIIV